MQKKKKKQAYYIKDLHAVSSECELLFNMKNCYFIDNFWALNTPPENY